MIQKQKTLLAALLYPIVALLALTAFKAYVVSTGREVTLPIAAYDPRDLLSGHYLTYTIDYGVTGICDVSHEVASDITGYVCLDPKGFSYREPEDCRLKIGGNCRGRRFEAGIERFYVPENKATALEAKIRDKKASIVLAVTADGRAQVKALLIDGEPWNERSAQ